MLGVISPIHTKHLSQASLVAFNLNVNAHAVRPIA